ncbi:MAG: Maf family protein [Gammaproteobacteria bacterium]
MIYLASKSPRRSQLLQEAGVSFKILEPSFDEIFDSNESVHNNAKRLSLLKAQAALKIILETNIEIMPILCADTIVTINGEMLGKPADKKEAKRMLKLLSNKMHSVVTGVTVVDLHGCFHSISVETNLYFKDLSDKEIEGYIDTDEPYDKAGGISSQGGAKKFITKIDGSYSNVLGLPIEESLDLLKKIKAI